jgi:hypothetical protein
MQIKSTDFMAAHLQAVERVLALIYELALHHILAQEKIIYIQLEY